MDELKSLLLQVEDSYEDFVAAMMQDAREDTSRVERLISFIKNHPEAHTDDIIGYIDDFPSARRHEIVA